MTEKIKILIALFSLAVGEGRPVSKIDRPYQGKEEPWNCNEDDDCRGNKAQLIAAGKLSATDVQQEVTDISRQLEKVLESYPGLELEILLTEGDDEIVIKAKVNLRGDNDIIDVSDNEDFIDCDEMSDHDASNIFNDKENLNDNNNDDDDDYDDDDDNDDCDYDDDDDFDYYDGDDNEDEDDDEDDDGIDMMLFIMSDGDNDEIDHLFLPE